MTEPHLPAAVESDLGGRIVRVSHPGRGSCRSQGRVDEAPVRAWIETVREALDPGVRSPSPGATS